MLLGAIPPSFTVNPLFRMSRLSSNASFKPSPSVSNNLPLASVASSFCKSPFSAISSTPSLSESSSK